MDITLDTNVLVAGLLNPSGPPGEIVDMVTGGMLCVVYDDRVIAEYESVLRRRKFGFARNDVRAVLRVIERVGRRVLCSRVPVKLPDEHDRCFLECARASESKTLVTGNIRHFPTPKRFGVRVASPGEFLGGSGACTD